MNDTNKSHNKLNKALHEDINKLWDNCFGDLPMVTQRLLKAYGTIHSKDAYTHRRRLIPITAATIQKYGSIDVFDNERHFPAQSKQVKRAQSLANKIIKKMTEGEHQACKVLKDFLKDKKVVIGVDKGLSDDACFSGFNPLTKEIYIDLCAGTFYNQQKSPELFNEDSISQTLGHELGHAVEQLNRSSKSDPNYVGYSSNGWEVESFCDVFGASLTIGAGYTLTPSIEKAKLVEDAELKNHRAGDPHPTKKQRRKMLELMAKAYPTNTPQPTQFGSLIKDVDWNEKSIQQQEQIQTNAKEM